MYSIQIVFYTVDYETAWTGKEILLGTEKTMTGDGVKNAIYTANHIKESSD